MNKQTITREKIREWLYTYQTGERLFEDYYKKNGSLIKMEDLYENENEFLSAPTKDPRMYIYTDFKCLNVDFQNLRESREFYEEDYFYPFWDVALYRHPRFYPEFRHDHKFFEICYVLQGECVHSVEQLGRTEKYCLKSGDLIILPPYLAHSVRMDTDSVAVNILIRRSTFEETFLRNIQIDTLLFHYFAEAIYDRDILKSLVFHTECDEELPRLFYDIAYTYCNGKTTSGQIVNLQISIFFSKLLEDHLETIEILGNEYEAKEKIPAILQYINLNYAHMSLDDIAEHFHFSASYLRKLFKESTGQTLISALQQVRLSKARELLEKTELSVEKITNLVGYEDTTHFIRLFKKETGMTPAKYRKEKIRQTN